MFRLNFGGFLLIASLVLGLSSAQADPLAVMSPGDVTVTIFQSKDPYFTGTATTTGGVSPVTITYNDSRSGLTNCNATGTIQRTWTAVDAANNVSTCGQTITTVDNVAPQFTAFPTNIVAANDPGLPSAVVNYPVPVAKDVGFNEGFEDPAFVSGNYANNPSVDWNNYNGHLYRVPSGTDGIISRNGAAHAVIDPTVPVATPDANGVFSRLGGYSSVFGTGFRVAQDIYMDLSNPGVVNATATNGYAWDLSAAANNQNNQYQCEFIFHTAAYDPTGIVVVGDNSGSSDDARYRRNDLLTVPNHAVLTNSGWYTFEWIFRNDANALAVDMNVRDVNGALLYTQTYSNPANPIDTVMGGHRYLWFTFLAVDKLAIDNTVLERDTPVVCSIPSGSTFPVGINTVTCTATDACGNSTNASFTVVVSDGQTPSPAPKLSLSANASGQCSLKLAGVPGYRYAIEGSVDSVHWIPLCTNASPFTFADSNAPGLGHRIYRALYLP